MNRIFTLILVLLTSGIAYAETYTVEKVIDAATLKMTNGEEVRLIGIDAPKIVFPKGVDRTLFDPSAESGEQAQRWGVDLDTLDKMGQEARKFVELILPKGAEVRFEFDVQSKDKNNRILSYVFVPYCDAEELPLRFIPSFLEWEVNPNKKGKDWVYIFLNATIIKSGHGIPMAIPPNVKYADLFKQLYEEAREAKRGFWKEDDGELEMIDCTMDVKPCPDGSSVGRVPPNCEFKACPEYEERNE